MPRPRKRRVSPQTERRNAAARAKGYRNYYHYRLHGYGRTPPDQVLSKDAKRSARGHAGKAAFLRSLRPGDTVSLVEPVAAVKLKKGRTRMDDVFVKIVKLVISGRTGLGRTFTIRNITRRQLRAMIADEERRGAAFMPQPSLDQRKLLSKADYAS